MPALIAKPLPNHGGLIWSVTTAPVIEPIDADDVKDWGKIETDAEDTLIESLITAVRQVAEPWLGRSLIEQTIMSTLNFWPDNPVRLPRPPLISVSSISTIDEEGNSTTYSTDNYFVRTDIVPGEVVVKNGSAPPINTDRYYGGFQVVHVSGYGDEASDVPMSIRHGLIEWVLHALENRQVDREPPDNAMPLLGAYRIMKI